MIGNFSIMISSFFLINKALHAVKIYQQKIQVIYLKNTTVSPTAAD